MFAGFLNRAPIELVPCVSIDMEVPAEAEIVIEAKREQPGETRRVIAPETARTLPGSQGDALKAVQHITSNDASRLAINQIQYAALTTPQGTFVDDVLTYKLSDEHFMLVVNAGNIPKDAKWVTEQIAGIGDAVAVNTS